MKNSQTKIVLAFFKLLMYNSLCVNLLKGGVIVANIKSAKKRILVVNKKTARNKRVKSHIKDIVKSFDAAIAESDIDAAQEKLTFAEKRLKQAAAKGTIHKNAASRKVSRLAKKLNAEK